MRKKRCSLQEGKGRVVTREEGVDTRGKREGAVALKRAMAEGGAGERGKEDARQAERGQGTCTCGRAGGGLIVSFWPDSSRGARGQTNDELAYSRLQGTRSEKAR